MAFIIPKKVRKVRCNRCKMKKICKQCINCKYKYGKEPGKCSTCETTCQWKLDKTIYD